MTKEGIFSVFEFFNGVTSFMSVVAPIILGFAGFALIIYSLGFAYKRRKKVFVDIPVKVLNTELQTSMNHDTKTIYTPIVKYEYTVEGKTYQSSRVFYGVDSYGCNDKYSMEVIVKKYSSHENHTGQLNNNDANDVYLESKNNLHLMFLIIGLGFVLISWVLLNAS